MFKSLSVAIEKRRAAEASAATEGLLAAVASIGGILIKEIVTTVASFTLVIGALVAIAIGASRLSEASRERKVSRSIRTYAQLKQMITDVIYSHQAIKAILKLPPPHTQEVYNQQLGVISKELQKLGTFSILIEGDDYVVRGEAFFPPSAGDKKSHTAVSLGYKDNSIKELVGLLSGYKATLARAKSDISVVLKEWEDVIAREQNKYAKRGESDPDAEVVSAWIADSWNLRGSLANNILKRANQSIAIIEGDLKYLAKTFYTDEK